MRNETVRVLGREDSFYFSPEEICTVSMKHGAIAAVAFAAIVLLGALSGGAYADAAALAGAGPAAVPMDPASTESAGLPDSVTEALEAVAPERPWESAGGVLLASTAPDAALLTALVQSASLGQAPVLVPCSDLNLAFSVDKIAGGPTAKFTFTSMVTTASGLTPNIIEIRFYISGPNATETDDGYIDTWPSQVSKAYNPTQGADQQKIEIGGEGNTIFKTAGLYSVGIRVRMEDPDNPGTFRWCGNPLNNDIPVYVKDLLTINESDDLPKADFKAEDKILDTTSVPPSSSWMPLFEFTMSYGDPPAPRVLVSLVYRITGDPKAADRSYSVLYSPREEDFYQFGLIPDALADDEWDSELEGLSSPVIVWDNHGAPYDYVKSIGDLSYSLTFGFDPNDPNFNAADPFNPGNPTIPSSQWVVASADPGTKYFVVFRTSSVWRTYTGLAVEVPYARMHTYSGSIMGVFPVGDNGDKADTYSPDFYAVPAEMLDEETAYSAAFGVFDVMGGWDSREPNATEPPTGSDMFINNLNYPQTAYTPIAEHTRPRWDRGAGIVFEGILGEVMNFRQLTGTDDWKAVLGLDVHGLPDYQPYEFNIICTDVGADPFGMPGNGGFDPRYGLERFSDEGYGGCDSPAIHDDYSFNGVSLYHDTNHDGRFQPPTPQGTDGNTYGVTFTDFPMYTGFNPHSPDGYVTAGLNEWEYIPFPPSGGDPWWKIKVMFSGGRRRCATDQVPTGYFTPTPDPFMDYFVVLRTDSGHTDVSGITSDGNGLKMGSETRVFIEPRRWDTRDNHWEGGILLSNQIPDPADFPATYLETHDGLYWQDAAVFNTYGSEISQTPQPWWPERTHNQDTVKPVRFNVEVHDLTLTYTSNNMYGKLTDILWYPNVPGALYGGDNFMKWVDPFHFSAFQFVADLTSYDYIYANINLMTNQAIFTYPHAVGEHCRLQYAYESTPFRRYDTDQMIVGDFEFPASSFYPVPPEQPTLPDFSTWPIQDGYGPALPPNPGNVVDFGLRCSVYVDPATTADNQPFHVVTTSSSTETYRNDQYHVQLEDGTLTSSVAGMWFIDRLGAQFHIESSTGNSLVLSSGQVVCPDSDRSVGKTVNSYIWNGPVLDEYPYSADYPFISPSTAFAHGSWMIVREVLRRSTYPRQSDWPNGLNDSVFPGVANPGLRAARLLKQHVEVNSLPTAMLGVNLIGTNDPVVNRAGGIKLNSVTVAFWGPEFDPSDLAKLDSQTGLLPSSGVMLYEDANQDGVFGMGDSIVPVEPTLLSWSSKAEPIDLDGDEIPDDLSGDGLVVYDDATYQAASNNAAFDSLYDLAWVLVLKPRLNWPLPFLDARVSGSFYTKGNTGLPSVGDLLKLDNTPSYWTEPHYLFTPPEKEAKALPQSGGNAGDDLFVAICTSDTISAFENFRCMIPAHLPSRTTPLKREAGVSVAEHEMDDDACRKFSAEEETLQDFYGHDMIEVNVPSKIVDLSPLLAITVPGLNQQVPVVVPGGPPAAVLGIDASSNKPENQIAKGKGTSSIAVEGNFQPSEQDIQLYDEESSEYYSSGWSSKVVGCYLVTMGGNPGVNDSDTLQGLRGFEITAVNGNSLTLRSGIPAAGYPWCIVKDPTFLEQIIVELYDFSDAAIGASFNPHTDFLPLNIEDPARNSFSGVSIYRDNDSDPRNTNGVFDPPMIGEDEKINYIDYPVELDDAPVWILSPGESNFQVKFVFSSPGTDNSTGRDDVDYQVQPLLRQWVPQTFGASPEDPEYGSDFFVVVRPSGDMNIADSFRAAICSWGPNTPTEPDPDNFSNIYGSTQQRDEFDIFSEFPGCSRALGFITMFRDPIPVRYWSFDPVLQKQIPIMQLDRSQDAMPVRNWVRTNANVVNINTLPIVATAKTKLDFTASTTRQIVGGDIVFTMKTSVTNIMKVKWDFGDGTSSSETTPTHAYDALGQYTVSLTITDVFGVETTKEKAQYIEILDTPFANFTGTPLDAPMTPDPLGVLPPGLDVQFTDSSIGSVRYSIAKYFWDFGDLESATPPDEADDMNPLHRYTEAGVYTVKLTVSFLDIQTDSETFVTRKLERQGYVTVRPCVGCEAVEGSQDGETEIAPAKFSVESAIRDKESLVPLSDYVPLIRFSMSYESDNPADRILQILRVYLRPDDRDPLNELKYGNMGGPRKADIREFALFQETPKSDDKYNKVLDPTDLLMYVWDTDAKCLYHYFDSSKVGLPIGTLEGESILGELEYTLNFVGSNSGSQMSADFPVNAGANNDKLDGNSYIIAVRTSAYWRAQSTMACDVLGASMIRPETGKRPVDGDGASVDDYAPNFYADDPETLEEKVAYSSSFAVWDISGSYTGESATTANDARVPDEVLPFYDTWDRPLFLFTPLAEYTRPRWSKSTELMDMMAGEFLGMRKLVGQDEWRDVIGIDLHSTRPFYSDTDGMAQLREVNLIVTDIGADPYGAPGNGGLNPNDGLENITTQLSLNFEPDAKDITFNGAWVWFDSNHNGVFDKPTVGTDGKVTFAGDYPMYPDYMDDLTDLNPLDPPIGVDLKWEYIPLPPGGGDPWWKINMRFAGGRKRPWGELDSKDGYVEPVPNNYLTVPSGSQVSNDYFVVIRTDSGFTDVSHTVPDGVGIQMGADFRAFIEPRRTNSIGNEDGGIYVDSMIPELGARDDTPWQSDAGWGTEPWWPQRTVNEKSSKPFKVGVDVHDLVLVYTSDSIHNISSDIFFGSGSYWDYGCMGFAYTNEGYPTDFEQWMDPHAFDRGKFFYGQSVGVTRWRTQGTLTFTVGGCGCFGGADDVSLSYNQIGTRGTYAYETVPFEHGKVPGMDERSSAYRILPEQPTLPALGKPDDEDAAYKYVAPWPVLLGQTGLAPGEYPRASNWDAASTQADHVNARLLTQKVDTLSSQTPMLGINLASTSDPVVLAGHERMSIARLSVAFWGPDFTPADLMDLDPQGLDYDSGVMLWQDSDHNGVFFEAKPLAAYWDLLADISGFDTPVAVRDLAWGSKPEPVDMDGDGVADDMNGDGMVDSRDYAWVLTFYPENQWYLPNGDGDIIKGSWSWEFLSCPALGEIADEKKADAGDTSKDFNVSAGNVTSDAKQTEGATDDTTTTDEVEIDPGDDLFLTVKTSENAKRFSQFRAVVPATLPGRSDDLKKAGIQFFPQVNTSSSAFVKSSPEEEPVQDFYGHDMLQFNVPVRLLDMTNQNQQLTIAGAALPVMGFDASTNRGNAGETASGASGSGQEGVFSVQGANWVVNQFAGDYLVDSRYESFEILSNTADTLTLRSGEPRDGRWRIVNDPTFLEQVVVELYNEGEDADFNPLFDLLPLNKDQELSGVALYRDNDSDPNNRNGLFDPDIDIPLALDGSPCFIGQTGENTQVRFIFSTPGTDDAPLPMAEQTRNRQWVPDRWGVNSNDEHFGADFFVVVRSSENMQDGDNFRIGLVNWGPNTPTEPDPDSWANLPGEDRNDATKFEEFPWAVRGLGFISVFKDPQPYYFMDGATAKMRVDSSGFNFVRSHTSKKRETGVITAKPRVLTPISVVIESASATQLPSQTLDNKGFALVIFGKNFGTNPDVTITGYNVTINSVTDTAIKVTLTTIPDAPPVEPIVIIVRNTKTGESACRSNLFTLVPGNPADRPRIDGVSPGSGAQNDFPVTVTGANFAAFGSVDVLFGTTTMPVLGVNAAGTQITVGYPLGGMPVSGPLNVTVRNLNSGTEDILVGGFDFVSEPVEPKLLAFLGCSSAMGAEGGALGDLLVVLVFGLGLCAVKRAGVTRRARSGRN